MGRRNADNQDGVQQRGQEQEQGHCHGQEHEQNWLGGGGTLLGHPFRSQVGDRFWLARLEAVWPLLPPWISLRTFAAAGAATLTEDDNPIGLAWGANGDAGTRASAGLGVALGWDVLQLDLGRGVDGGKWELVVSVDRRFRGWL